MSKWTGRFHSHPSGLIGYLLLPVRPLLVIVLVDNLLAL